MSGKRVPLRRSTSVLWRGPALSNHATDSAESVLLLLAPKAGAQKLVLAIARKLRKAMQSQEVRLRLSEEQVQTAADLLELDKATSVGRARRAVNLGQSVCAQAPELVSSD